MIICCAACRVYDYVIKWKGFRITGPLWGESTGYRWIPLTMCQLCGVFLDISLKRTNEWIAWNKLLSKQWRLCWLEMLWQPCSVTLMIMLCNKRNINIQWRINHRMTDSLPEGSSIITKRSRNFLNIYLSHRIASQHLWWNIFIADIISNTAF